MVEICFPSMVHCCYDFRLKLLELLIENIVHFRFDILVCYESLSVDIVGRSFENSVHFWCEFNVLEFEWLRFFLLSFDNALLL